MKYVGKRGSKETTEWLSISDLMAGLMIVFLFIAVSYMRPILETQKTVKAIVVAWNESELNIHEALKKEFKNDLPKWDAELRQDLTIRFKAPDVLFDTGKATLKPKFMNILADFFPRYLSVLSNFRTNIDEVRIEGHTSSIWEGAGTVDEAYFRNMELSQARTRTVLEYSLGLNDASQHKDWARSHITANGLSSSHLVRDPHGVENPDASRRVEFRIRTKTKDRILQVLGELESDET